jgi:hypothetical protein
VNTPRTSSIARELVPELVALVLCVFMLLGTVAAFAMIWALNQKQERTACYREVVKGQQDLRNCGSAGLIEQALDDLLADGRKS